MKILGFGFCCLNAGAMGDPVSYFFRKLQISRNLLSSRMPLDTSVYATESPISLLHTAAHYKTFFTRL